MAEADTDNSIAKAKLKTVVNCLDIPMSNISPENKNRLKSQVAYKASLSNVVTKPVPVGSMLFIKKTALVGAVLMCVKNAVGMRYLNVLSLSVKYRKAKDHWTQILFTLVKLVTK